MAESEHPDERESGEALPVGWSDEMHARLRGLARSFFRAERPGHTLQPTALVHEAWLRLGEGPAGGWSDRHHFLAAAAQVMRRVLVDHARSRASEKRGGDLPRVDLSAEDVASEGQGVSAYEIDDLLERLARSEPERARIAVLRLFGGMTHEEIAHVEGASERTIERRWRSAKAWLAAELSRDGGEA